MLAVLVAPGIQRRNILVDFSFSKRIIGLGDQTLPVVFGEGTVQLAIHRVSSRRSLAFLVVYDSIGELRPAIDHLIALAFNAPVQKHVTFFAPAIVKQLHRSLYILATAGNGTHRTGERLVCLMIPILSTSRLDHFMDTHGRKRIIGIILKDLALQIAQTSGHHLDPSTHIALQDFCLNTGTIQNHVVII